MFDRLTVRARLIGLVLLLFAVLLLVGVVGLLSTSHVRDRLKTVYEDRMVCTVQLFLVMDNLHRARGRIWAAMLTDDPATAAQEVEGIAGFLATADQQWHDYISTSLTSGEKVLADKFDSQFKEIHSVLAVLGPIAAQGDRRKTAEADSKTGFRKLFTEARDTLGKLEDLQSSVAKTEYEGGIADFEAARSTSILLIIFGLLGGAGVAWMIIRSITAPLDAAVVAAQTIAEGNLTHPVPKGAGAELGRLLDAMDAMQAALKRVVGAIKQDAIQVGDTAGQLAHSSVEVAKASGMQSEASSSIAASVEQMTVSITHISNRTHDTRNLTQEVGQLSERGAVITRQTTDGVRAIASKVSFASGQIDELSHRIDQVSNIVNVIKDIADQTNLLALNAAIEAARAGEQGRGFAVVADEVRKLAERTSLSTQQIAQVIGEILSAASVSVSSMRESVEQVEDGVRLSEEAAEAIRDIQAKEAGVIAAVNEIADALREQSQASTDIARQIETIAQATEENGAAIKAMAESSGHLNGLGQSLLASVERFRT